MTTTAQTVGKMGLLSSLYLSQGLPFGFFTQALPVIMRNQGYSLEAIGLATILALPWALKFLWAPLVDRYGSNRFGRRRSWILPLQAITVLTLLGVAFVPSEKMLALLIAVFVTNLLSATQDIATDGLAVDMLAPSERGVANGVQVAGYRLGMIVGGGLLLIVHDDIGWDGTFIAMAAAIALASLPVWMHRERFTHSQALVSPSIKAFFRQRGVFPIVAVVLTYKSGDALASAMLRPFLVDLGLTLADVGWLLGTVGFVAGLVGALAGGALVVALGRKPSLIIFGLLQAGAVGAYVIPAAVQVSPLTLYVLCGAEHFTGGMATAALFTCMMDWCRVGSNATDYTIQASLVVVATGIASAASGFLASNLGYVNHFALGAAATCASVWIVIRLFPQARDAASCSG